MYAGGKGKCSKLELKMKKIILILFLGVSFQANAQLIGAVDLFRMIFSWQEGGYEVKLTSFNGEPAFLHGIRGGWYINQDDKKDILLGIGMYGAYTELYESRLSTQENLFTYYSSLYCGITLEKDKPIRFEIPVHIGYGFVTMEDAYYGNDLRASGYLLFEPNLNALFRLGKSIRFGLGAGYRLVGGIRMDGTDNVSMSSLTLNATLRFGRYE